MRPSQLIRRLGIIQLDIQVLVDALQRAADADLVLEFDGDFMVYECFEEAAASVSAQLLSEPLWDDDEYSMRYARLTL